jgi:phage shock protein A
MGWKERVEDLVRPHVYDAPGGLELQTPQYRTTAVVREERRRLGMLLARQRATALQARVARVCAGAAVLPDLRSELCRLRRKVERAEAEAEALESLAAAEPVPLK